MKLDLFSDGFREGVWSELESGARSRLERYWADLLRYNRAQNLISRRDPEVQLASLIEECVRASQLLGARGLQGGRWADVGSGGGIPGLVLGALDPDQELVLIERRQGRCDFLRREVRLLGLENVQVEEGDARESSLGPFDVVFAKAVANPGEIELLCAPLVAAVLVVFGRASDPVADGWRLDWLEDLGGNDAALRGLVRA